MVHIIDKGGEDTQQLIALRSILAQLLSSILEKILNLQQERLGS